jgi:hypothetical protein
MLHGVSVSRIYLTSVKGFWFDAATSIPFSWIDWGVLQVRQGHPIQVKM